MNWKKIICLVKGHKLRYLSRKRAKKRYGRMINQERRTVGICIRCKKLIFGVKD